jgi:hypothetical protein
MWPNHRAPQTGQGTRRIDCHATPLDGISLGSVGNLQQCLHIYALPSVVYERVKD